MPKFYYNSNHELHLEEKSFSSLCAQYETPFYVYSRSIIEKNCQDVLNHCQNSRLTPYYALKANYNPAILKLIFNYGFGADVVSGGEMFFAEKAGVKPGKIVFAGVGKTDREISDAIKKQIHSLNVESEAELARIEQIAENLQTRINIAVRINPDIDPKTHPYISTGLHTNKFGVTREKAIELFKRASQHQFVNPVGVHVHIGSQIDQTDPFIETAEFLLKFIAELRSYNIQIQVVDLGGGIGINYQNQLDDRVSSRTYIDRILPRMLAPFAGTEFKLLVELGRSIIGSAGFLVTRVLYTKKTPQKKFVIVDAAMNNLIRPSLYQAHHQILKIHIDNDRLETVDVVGPVCETSDFLAKDRELPEVKTGDFLVISGAGAYGQALSSIYNLRPTIPEYLVDGKKVDTIFKGETIESIADRYSW